MAFLKFWLKIAQWQIIYNQWDQLFIFWKSDFENILSKYTEFEIFFCCPIECSFLFSCLFLLSLSQNKNTIKIEFKEERKVLLEVIGPELQSIYDDRQIEVGCVECLLELQRWISSLLFTIIVDWICRYALWHWYKPYKYKCRLRSICALRSSKWDTNLSSCVEEYFLYCKLFMNF